jgi:hypothetical protein
VTTHRRYFFQHPGEYTRGNHAQILALLQHYCEKHWWYNEPEVTGAPFNRLTFSFEVCARDQWWCHRRAMWLAARIYESSDMRGTQVPVPMWENLSPYENRGRSRVSPQKRPL